MGCQIAELRTAWYAPGNLEALTCRIGLCYQSDLLIVVVFLELFRRDTAAGGVKPLAVVPGDPFHGGDGNITDTSPWPVPVDEFSLVQGINRLGRSIVVRVSLAAHGTDSAYLTQPLTVAYRSILHAAVGMMHEL